MHKRSVRTSAGLIAGCVTLFSALNMTACRSQDDEPGNPRAASIPAARVATAQRGEISHALTLAGQFQPYQVVDVHPKVSGYMRRINVDIGDIVRQGQTLALLEVPELKAQLRQTARNTRSIAPSHSTRPCMKSMRDCSRRQRDTRA